MGNEFLSPKELADRWRGRVSVQTLAAWRSQKTGPPYTKAGGSVLYPLKAVEKYEQKNLVK